MPIYTVETQRFGQLLKTADTIAEARAWLRRALPDDCAGPVARLRAVTGRQPCPRCGLVPCIARRPGSRLTCA